MPVAVVCTFGFTDAKGKSSSTEVKIPNGLTITDMVDFAIGFGQTLIEFTGARLTSCSISLTIDLSTATIRSTPQAVSDVEDKVLVTATDLDGFPIRMNVPTHREFLAIDGTDQYDDTLPEVAAFIAVFESGITIGATEIKPFSKYGNDAAQVDNVREIFRRRKAR